MNTEAEKLENVSQDFKTKPGFRGILLVMMLGFYRLCLTLSRALLYSKNCKQKVVESFFRFSCLFVLMPFAF